MTSRTRFRHARFYVTFRCNARCGYCNVWQDPVFFRHRELGDDEIRRCLDQIREIGVEYLDLTGGEPTLHAHLETAVRHAAQIGMQVEVTTNAISFPRASNFISHVSTINISLDTVSSQRYHEIRGKDTLDRTMALITRLRAEGTRNLKLIAVITRRTVDGLNELVSFARDTGVPVYLSPMFEYFEGQRDSSVPKRTPRPLRLVQVSTEASVQTSRADVRPQYPRLERDQASILHTIRAHSYTPYTMVSLDALRHLEKLDPSEPTVCGAGTRILTVGPDGRVLLPCYHEWDSSLMWDQPYRDLIEHPMFLRVRDEDIGNRPGCRSCSVFPYLGLAKSYRLTAEFLVQAVSHEIIKVKRCLEGLEGESPALPIDLSSMLDRLLARLEQLALRPGTHLDELYHFEAVRGVGATSDIAAGPVAVEEVFADHAREDCWRVQRTPHRIARLLYTDIVPALVDLARDGSTEARRLAGGSLVAHLALWDVWLDVLVAKGPTDRQGGGGDELTSWCRQTGNLLAASCRASSARSVAAIALASSVPELDLEAWGGVKGHPEEALFAKLTRTVLPTRRRIAVAGCFAPTLAAMVSDGADAPSAAVHKTEVVLARAAGGDGAQLDALCCLGRQLCMAGDTIGFRSLVRAWKVAGSRDADRVEKHLLARELGQKTTGDVGQL